jgi:methylmalonyl-CoA epimerase
MIKGIYGINIAVKDLDAAVKKYEDVLGVKSVPIAPNEFAFPGLIGAKLEVGGTIINLIASTQEGTSIAKFVESKGEGLFLVSLLVDDIENDVKEMEKKGVKFVLDKIAEAPIGKVNFVHPKTMHGVQFEVLQLKK